MGHTNHSSLRHSKTRKENIAILLEMEVTVENSCFKGFEAGNCRGISSNHRRGSRGDHIWRGTVIACNCVTPVCGHLRRNGVVHGRLPTSGWFAWIGLYADGLRMILLDTNLLLRFHHPFEVSENYFREIWAGLGLEVKLANFRPIFHGFLIGSIDKFRSGNCDVLPTIGSSDFDFRRVMVACIQVDGLRFSAIKFET